jgi:hypothetical protein
MRRRIREVLADGVKPEQVVAVVGAFHAPVLGPEFPAMTGDELARLRRRSSKLTLMPYSYFKLSSQSGYGAGNRAPAYFDLCWELMQRDGLAELPHRYLSEVVRHQRAAGTYRSTAEVIEGVRLARTLAALHDGTAPTLADLHDAAVTLIGHGERSGISESLASVDVGTAIGELPRGVSRTSIQEDFDRQMARLKLEKYRTTVAAELELDIREDRRAKSEESAFLDLRRSAFFHRLRVLDIGFAKQLKAGSDQSTWYERWKLQWTPESEIALVEAVDRLNDVSDHHADRVDVELWVRQLRRLSDADDRNPLLSGYACAVLLERGQMATADLSREVSRRLSPGIPADLGAGWFEGLSMRNRGALLARQPLWVELAGYVAALDDDQFRRAIVFLRRAFGGFTPHQKRQICENLAEHWGVSADAASEALTGELSEKEQKKIAELGEFNFDDI